ncbi:MAG: hypothetical protein Q4B50_06870 [Bacillota bacterium]|nr:hypothetical protein [Bacillota bacterium]
MDILIPRRKRSLRESVGTNFFLVPLVAILILFGGELLMEMLDSFLRPLLFQGLEAEDALRPILERCWEYALFLIPGLLCIFYILLTRKESLRSFSGRHGNNGLLSLFLGLLLGAAILALQLLPAYFQGNLRLSLNSFSPWIFLLLPAVLLYAGCMELIFRCYIYQHMKGRYGAILGTLMLCVCSLAVNFYNFYYQGFHLEYALHLFLFNMLLLLLMRRSRSIWLTWGLHSAWIFGQHFVLGLPVGGVIPEFSIFSSSIGGGSFYYELSYGLEGSLLHVLFLAAFCLIMIIFEAARPRMSMDDF